MDGLVGLHGVEASIFIGVKKVSLDGDTTQANLARIVQSAKKTDKGQSLKTTFTNWS